MNRGQLGVRDTLSILATLAVIEHADLDTRSALDLFEELRKSDSVRCGCVRKSAATPADKTPALIA